MLRIDLSLRLRSLFLGIVVLSLPSALLAQRGPGGHLGGGTAGGTGMGSNGSPTGLDIKDDLQGFHTVLAVQATIEQAGAYAAMMKSTAAADADLKALEQHLRKETGSAAIATPVASPNLTTLNKQAQDALEGARSLNKKFLESFSEPQKTGLKEVSKRLIRSDAELAQQARALDEPTEARASGPQMSISLENLAHALTTFQRAQLDLGEEMSIPSATNAEGFTYNLAQAKNPVEVGSLAMTVTTSGLISKTASAAGQNTFAVTLNEDLSDLQLDIADILRLRLDSSDRCGERVAIQSAELMPRDPAALVVAQLHYERWTCSPVFGRDGMNEMVEGNGTIEIQLTPAVAQDGTMKLVAQTGQVDAHGLIGELLRSGSLGQTMRDKTAEAFVSIIRQGGDFKAALPSGVRNYATLRHAEFHGTGSGKLIVQLNGEVIVSNEQLSALTAELQRATEQPIPGPLLTRPPTSPDTVSR